MSREHQSSEFRINDELASRSQDGVWGHPLCFGLVCLTTTFIFDHPFLTSFIALLFLAQTAIRIRLLRALPSEEGRCSVVWRSQLLSLLIFSGAMWGMLAAWSCYIYGFHHPNTILLLLYHAAIAVVGAPTFVHDLRLTRLYLALLFIPPMLVHGFFPDAQRWGPLCTFAAYGLFLSGRAAKLHVQYLRHQAENRELRAVAGSDPLTGLPNRLSMVPDLERAIESARTKGLRLAVLFIDLDGFKAINDRFSHRVGDLFLCEIAKRFASCGRSPGSVFRLGGDEFTLLLSGVGVSDLSLAQTVAASVLEAARLPATIEGNTCTVAASIGISFFPDDAETGQDLLRAADHAMYEAKRTGANQICFAGTRKIGEAQRYADSRELMLSEVR